MVRCRYISNFGGGYFLKLDIIGFWYTLKSIIKKINNSYHKYNPAFTLSEGAMHLTSLPIAARFGFTLAEVLITLCVIGVVSAMTIPTMITNYQKRETVTRLKSAYAQLQLAIKLSESDNDELGGWDLTTGDWFDRYIAPYLKVTKIEFKDLSDIKSIPYKQISGSRETGLALLRPGFGGSNVYTLLNGIDIIAANEKNKGLIVDINGVNSKPNQFGKDTFYMVLYPEFGLTFLGMRSTTECKPPVEGNPGRDYLKNTNCLSYFCNNRGRGMWCGALIMTDSWTISKDYPW